MNGIPPLDLGLVDFRHVVRYLRILRGSRGCAHPMNFPGPIYGTTENMMGCAPLEYDRSGLILVAEGYEILWRQPLDLEEQVRVLEAITSDESVSYGIDGDSWWSRDLVDAWRRETMPRVLAWAQANKTGVSVVKDSGSTISVHEAGKRVAQLIEYYQGAAVDDLAAYASRLGR